MTKTILVVGIGAGDPDQVTIQAVKALNRADVVFLPDKGEEKDALAALRREICRRHIARPHRTVIVPIPPRRPPDADYAATVRALNDAKVALYRRLIDEALGAGECGAFLVWGDPSLYDSTLRNLLALRAAGTAFALEVIPGVTSIQALAARHRLTLTGIGEPFTVTTGRRLADGLPADTTVVMLDAADAYAGLVGQDLDIFWGAYVGMPGEILVAGRLADVAGEIAQRRAAARAAHGWIMDSYVLRRRTRGD